jgi:hypothetical protein
MNFLSKEHENRFVSLLHKDKTHPSDVERLALFYIIAGNDDLCRKVKYIYNFVEHHIEPDCLYDSGLDFCSSSRSLVKLAYNLYNGYQDNDLSPADLLSGLDFENFYLASENMAIRFGYASTVQSTLDYDEQEL